MIENATGIILRMRPLTETSLIVQWLTPALGRIATVAKGARRPKSPFQGKLDLFYEADFSFSRSSRSDLHNLREVSLQETHRTLREDIHKLQQAAYAAAFIEQATETETPLAELFGLFKQFLDHLCAAGPSATLIFAFELKLLTELGLEPDFRETALTAGSKKVAALLADTAFERLENLKLTAQQIAELKQFLHGFLIFHLGRLPKGRSGALEITFR